MPENPRFALRSVSVVVTAEFHNPSILNPDFLKTQEIVSADWTVAETLTTPPVSVVKYNSGVEWTLDQSRLTIAENRGPAFDDGYRVHRLAVAYLQRLPYVPLSRPRAELAGVPGTGRPRAAGSSSALVRAGLPTSRTCAR